MIQATFDYDFQQKKVFPILWAFKRSHGWAHSTLYFRHLADSSFL